MNPHRFAPWVSEEAEAQFLAESRVASPSSDAIADLRDHYDRFNRRHLAVAQAAYAVDIVSDEWAGVRVDLVTPAGGVRHPATLLCLHGGAFMWGRGAGAKLEAVPVAAVTGMRVVAVEYSLAPERVYPAAVDDVLAVYHRLSEQQSPASIGIYGCSAGAILTAQATARMIQETMPRPGGLVMLCGAGLEMLGDSVATAALANGQAEERSAPDIATLPYFLGTDLSDPLVFPGNHPEILTHFPPSLLVTGTRDFAASSVTVMHRRLIAAGVEASLLHFDGMWHAFHMATTLPEAHETFAAMADFFTAKLS